MATPVSRRWQQIEDVFHAVLAHDPAERRSFLDKACGDDIALREEVESLLSHESEADKFLETRTPPSRHFIGLRRGFDYLLSKRTLQTALILPLAILAFGLVRNRHLTIAALVADNIRYFYWIAAAAVALRFRQAIRVWLDRNFFREEYDRENVLLRLPDELKNVGSLPEMSGLIEKHLDLALHPRVMYFWYRKSNQFTGLAQQLEFPPNGTLLSWLELNRTISDVSPASNPVLTSAEKTWLAAIGAKLIVPVGDIEDELVGVWILGERNSGMPYSEKDRRLLKATAKQAAVTYQNLQLRLRIHEEQHDRRDAVSRLDRETFNLLKECPACGKCFDDADDLCDQDGQTLKTTLPVERTIHEKYTLEKLIGRGGMGAVYEARDLRLERKVAVKIMVGDAFGEQTAVRRFHREARAAARLNHVNIVSVFDFGRLDGGGAYLVMERLYGLTLRARLDRDGTLAPAAAADWFDPMLEGLAAAHAAGIVHRDLKPENVIGEEVGSTVLNVKILDFGLARFRLPHSASAANHLTGGFVLGTVGYMSPEHRLGREGDHRGDIFAAGVMLIEALSGWRPSDHEPDQILPNSSPEGRFVNEMLQQCLAPAPEDRPASAEVLRRDLIPALRACPR